MDDIHSRIDHISEELLGVRAQLYQSIKQRSGAVEGNGFDTSLNAENRFATVKREVGRLSATISRSGSSGEEQQIAKRATAQIQSCDSTIKVLSSLCSVGSLLREEEAAATAGNFLEAADLVGKAEQLLLEISTTSKDPEVLRVLKRLIRKRRAGLKGQLRDYVTAAIELKPGYVVVTRTITGYFCDRHFRRPLALREVFEALQRLDALDDIMAEVADRLRANLLSPMMASGHVPPPVFGNENGRPSMQYGAGTAASTTGGGLPAPVDLMSRLTRVLTFTHKEILEGKLAVTACLGRYLCMGPQGLLGRCQEALAASVPSAATELPAFSALLKPCREFEAALFDMGYIETETTQLSRFAADAHVHFAAQRQQVRLQEARDLMLGDYHNSIEVTDATERGSLGSGGADKQTHKKGNLTGAETRLFVLPRCHVTSVAQQLVEMAHQTLMEACIEAMPPLAAKELFRASRDMLDLFRAVVPVHHADQITHVPRIAALFHNDCLYIAHHVVTLGHQYRQRLPPPINKVATMVDMVPLFRDLGEARLADQLKQQRKQLREFLRGVDFLEPSGAVMAPGPEDSEDGPRRAIRKVMYHLHQLAQAWKHVLTDKVYARVMGDLLEGVVMAVMEPVLSCEEFEEEQTHTLHQIVNILTEAEQLGATERCPSWSRFRVMGDVMEYSLEQIGEHLQLGTFRCFTAQELGGLVCAIFQESPARLAISIALEKM
ncbi:unnamed protein product [Chrysoparadoxa australica]